MSCVEGIDTLLFIFCSNFVSLLEDSSSVGVLFILFTLFTSGFLPITFIFDGVVSLLFVPNTLLSTGVFGVDG